MQSSIIYAYNLLDSSCMFQDYYLTLFREMTPKYLKTYCNKVGHNKHTHVVVSTVQNLTGFG
jgi:hypothetical protein